MCLEKLENPFKQMMLNIRARNKELELHTETRNSRFSLYFTRLRAGITYPIFTDTYITDIYFSVYCIYFFEPENFFCK